MPARLRPTAPTAADAILVGDPGRALMLAQELLEQPKMSNHARGLWGYSGLTPTGHELTVQSTGMGGPSATVVLHDLAELGLRRAIRIGTGTSLSDLGLGDLFIVEEANSLCGSIVGPDTTNEPRNSPRPDPVLTARLREALPDARAGAAISLDSWHESESVSSSIIADIADMQTAALLAGAARLGVPAAAVLIVSECSDAGQLRDEGLEAAAKRAGTVAAAVLSP
jgi:uridine phosphorylase